MRGDRELPHGRPGQSKCVWRVVCGQFVVCAIYKIIKGYSCLSRGGLCRCSPEAEEWLPL